MSLANNNISILPISGYSPSFSWQVGFNNALSIPTNSLTFRATVRPLNGLEDFTRVPSETIYYEETGIVINSVTHQGQWTFPLDINAALTGGPYRDYQVVIEAHDSIGNTSAGNLVGTTSELGWVKFGKGYDILAITNPRQTGIEMGNNLLTQIASNTGLGDTGFYLNSGNGYTSLNYMGTHGEVNIRYLSGVFDSNLVGGYIYAWTGRFPKLDAALGLNGYNQVSKSQFSFDPTLGYVYHPTAAMAFRGSNRIYVSLSFYDNLDQDAIDNGINIATGLYLSDNAICYNDISAGSITVGGIQSIYSMQYTGNAPATGILGTGITILSSQLSNGNTSVVYLSNPANVVNLVAYTGFSSVTMGGEGGGTTLINNIPLSQNIGFLTLSLAHSTDDSLAMYLNGNPIKDDNTMFPSDPTFFDVLNIATTSGYKIKIGDTVAFSGKDNFSLRWSLPTWTGKIMFNDGVSNVITGGMGTSGASTATIYRDNGFLIVSRP